MKHEKARKLLTERLEQLVGQIGKIESDIRHETNPLDQDSQERSVQLVNEDVLAALDEAGRAELSQIRGALSRLDEGTFGTCVRCGEAIGEARLTAIPHAATCIRCAEAES